MTSNIDSFIKKQSTASICCNDEQALPYCFSCFYAYNSEEKLLYYKSSADTRHSLLLTKNPVVAGTILPDKLRKLQVKGIQFEGQLLPAGHPLAKASAAAYYRENPTALAVPGEVQTIQLNHIKFTDSSLGFGKKLHWHREDNPNA